MDQRKRYTYKYLFADWFAALLTWGVFYSYRKLYIESTSSGRFLAVDIDNNFWVGLFAIPFFWLVFYALIGTYSNVLRRSRLRELIETLYISVIGVLLIFLRYCSMILL